MIDHGARAYVCYTTRQKASKRSFHLNRLESKLARSYADDIDIRRGAHSAPRIQFRPGQRDDADPCTPVSMITLI